MFHKNLTAACCEECQKKLWFVKYIRYSVISDGGR